MINLQSIIETVLFVCGEPMALEKLSKITKAKKEAVLEALRELKKDGGGRGLVILEKGEQYQLGSNPKNTKYIEDLVKNEFSEELSRAAVETIAIIAYKGPLTRVEIEYVRGVNSSFTLRNLLMRGLVERIENSKDARSFLYRVSFDLLKHLGITKMEDLPQYEEFRKSRIEILEEQKTQ